MNTSTQKTRLLDLAVALSYERARDEAPKVVAKGQGFVAQKIKDLAIAHGIPIQQDQQLAKLLFKVDLEDEIPVEAFAAVAEILSYLYQQNSRENTKSNNEILNEGTRL